LPHGAWAGLASPTVTGQRRGHRRWHRGEGGVGDGVGNEDGVVSREAAEAPREVVSMVQR
jgi:hypothetical protein